MCFVTLVVMVVVAQLYQLWLHSLWLHNLAKAKRDSDFSLHWVWGFLGVKYPFMIYSRVLGRVYREAIQIRRLD